MAGQRHVLVVAYSFPPHGAIGTMRTLRVVRQLHAQGWQVTVLTGSPSHYLPQTPVDMALLARVPHAVRVVRAGAWHAWSRWTDALIGALRRGATGSVSSAPAAAGSPRPTQPRTGLAARLATVRNTIDALLSIPDGESGWFVPACMKGLVASLKDGRPDVVYSSSPAWTGQLVAYVMAILLRRPWVADFRDPWARAPWRGDRLEAASSAARFLENKVVRRANCVLFAARGNKEEFSTHYGEPTASKFHFVSNGCDPSEFEGLSGPATTKGPFVLLHAGSLYGGRSPLPVLNAVATAIREGTLDPATFRIHFLGFVGLRGLDLQAACEGLGLQGIVEFLGSVPREQSLAAMASASALLLLQPGHTVSVPGKLFEYLATGRPILAVAEEGEISEIVRSSGVGLAVLPGDERGLVVALERLVSMASSDLPQPPRSLFDGNVSAARTVEILEAVASGMDAHGGVTAQRSEGSVEAAP